MKTVTLTFHHVPLSCLYQFRNISLYLNVAIQILLVYVKVTDATWDMFTLGQQLGWPTILRRKLMHRLILFFQEEYMSIVQQQQKAAQEIQCWTFQLKLWWQIDIGISIKSKSHEILYKRSLVFESIADTVVVWSSSSCLQQILNIAPSGVILAPFSNLTAALTAKAIEIWISSSVMEFRLADFFSEKNYCGSPWGPRSAIFGPDDLHPMY